MQLVSFYRLILLQCTAQLEPPFATATGIAQLEPPSATATVYDTAASACISFRCYFGPFEHRRALRARLLPCFVPGAQRERKQRAIRCTGSSTVLLYVPVPIVPIVQPVRRVCIDRHQLHYYCQCASCGIKNPDSNRSICMVA